MRPLRLELKGFTAFRDEQVIDFDGFDLFAISGPTGSGKTSILDAITYALFGYIERVGKQAGQFVSQGQTRMAVCFEFAVDDTRYRVTRSTPAKGATKILLERAEGDGWVQAGHGADRVRDADALIREAIGLDYDAFTRTVLLPQGRFAEFLVGDAKERREILTDLLGLHLFERLARRAGECKRAANVEAETRARLLDTEYAGATPEAVERAETEAEEAVTREERLAQAKTSVDEIAARGAKTARSVEDLRRCGAEVRGAAQVASGLTDELARYADELAAAQEAAVTAEREATDAIAAARSAEATLRKAEGSWGRARDLTAVHVKAEQLLEHRETLLELRSLAVAASKAVPVAAHVLGEAEAALEVHLDHSKAALGTLEGARAAVDAATHADLVAAVRSGLAVGDACPVCGGRIDVLPKARGAPSLEKTKAALAKAEAAATTANEALVQAKTARADAERDSREAERAAERAAKDLSAKEGDLARREEEIRGALGGRLPKDPVAILDQRIRKIEELEAALAEAEDVAARAGEAAASASGRRDEIGSEVATRRARLEGLSVEALFERAVVLGEGEIERPVLVSLAEDATIAEVASGAGRTEEALGKLATMLDRLAEARARAQSALLDEANTTVKGFVVPLATLEELVEAVGSAHRAAARDAGTAAALAEQLAKQVRNAGALRKKITEHRQREERFDALAKELRADRIIAFLQLEALQLLASAGSERLAMLSSERYRLEYVDDEFFVVDTWNGEERRSARTLSGGETFLASLALALALSEQVGALSVTKKARLDSLFLDEGFGTLDPETLEVVVEAIEQLGGDGRMVGVITHVPELAARLPVTIRVTKSPRGSQFEIVR